MKALFKFYQNTNAFTNFVARLKEHYGNETNVESWNGDEYGIKYSDNEIVIFDLSSKAVINLTERSVLLDGSRGSLNQSHTSAVTHLLEEMWDEDQLADYEYLESITPELHPWDTNQTNENGERPVPDTVVAERLNKVLKLSACALLGSQDDYHDLVWSHMCDQIEEVEQNGWDAVGPWEYMKGLGLLPEYDTIFEEGIGGNLLMKWTTSTTGTLIREAFSNVTPNVDKRWVYQQLTKNM